MAGEVYAATPELIGAVIANARQADRVEMALMDARPLLDVVRDMADQCKAYVAVVDGEPACVYGVIRRRVLSGVGMPWMVASRAVEKPNVRRVFLRHGEDELRRIAANYTSLWGAVHAENRVAVRWLRWMGFEMVEDCEISGAPFHKFVRSV